MHPNGVINWFSGSGEVSQSQIFRVRTLLKRRNSVNKKAHGFLTECKFKK